MTSGAGPTCGIPYIIQNNWPDIEAEQSDRRPIVLVDSRQSLISEVEVLEKVGRGMRLVVHRTAGHGSMPRFQSLTKRRLAPASAFRSDQHDTSQESAEVPAQKKSVVHDRALSWRPSCQLASASHRQNEPVRNSVAT